MKDSLKSFCLATLLFLHLPFVSYAQVQLPTIDVGTADTRFAVSPLGGASYSVTFDAPQGLPGIQPKLELAYNSQAGNGLAGVGFSLSGISVITRGPRTIWYDGVASGITHGNDDAFFLDGQRLIEQENNVGADSVVYCMESSPYTRVVLYGRNASTQAGMWFRVTTPDGIVSEYGHTNGQQSYIKGNITKVNAWYITRSENAIGNYMTFQYSIINYFLYPQTISYGPNTIEFTYENRTDTIRFSLEGVAGYASKRLKSVKTKTGTNVFREYTLNYATSGDANASAYSRLSNIAVKNGSGEAMSPVSFQWDYLAQFNTIPNTLDVQLKNSTDTVTFLNESDLLAVDFNGDGISDILQHAFVASTGANNGHVEYYNYYYLHLSRIWGGEIIHKSVFQPIRLSPNIGGKWESYVNAPIVVDINGDGYQDVIIPYTDLELNNNACYYFLMGSEAYVNLSSVVTYSPQHSTKMPLYTTCDLDNDGKSDIVLLDKEGVGNLYHCHIVQGNVNFNQLLRFDTDLSLSSAPKKMMSGDFNCDGMADVLVICSNGYKIFWNRGGGLSNNTFSSADCTSGTTLKDNNMVREGDFNGDGILDILTNNTNSSDWYFYFGNGDGTFTKKWAGEIPIYDQSTSDDDDKFTCIVFDIDGDGKSDVFLSKAMYSDGPVDETRTYWMLSNGRNLNLRKSASSLRLDYASPYRYMLGSFSGNGLCELAHYGYDCFYDFRSNTDSELRAFPNTNYAAGNGLVKAFTNGLGHSVQVDYKLLTDNTVYSRSELGDRPFFLLKPALPVVATTIIGNGIAGNQTSHYSYEDLLAHQLRGLLGFTATSVENVTLGTVTNTTVERDEATQLVKKSTETTTLNGNTSTTVNNYLCHFHHNTKALYQSLASTRDTDMDGHVTNIVYTNDSTKNNVPLTITKTGYDNAQVKTIYGNYEQRAGQYLPMTVMNQRKHPDCPSYFTTTTTYTYNTKGLRTNETTLSGTAAELSTTYTYDSYGNVTNASTSGNGVETVARQYTYDTTHRFVTESLERGYIRNTYTYDTWGNVLTATDLTRSGQPQTTTNTYDGWGRLATSTSPTGAVSTWQWKRALGNVPGYYVRRSETGCPWVETFYDTTGRQWHTKSIGPQDIEIEQTLTFDNKGLLTAKYNKRGAMECYETYTYDIRGRLLIDQLDTEAKTYTYGTNWVTTTKAGHSYTKYYDSWGNVKRSTDPVSQVTYTYHSSGKPATATSNGNTVTMTYDAAGRQTQLTDPSAGTTTYTYDAYGRLLTQTDARGNTTTNTYNSRGQLTASTTGTITDTYAYGETASNNGLLLSATRGYFSSQYAYDNYGRVTSETRHYGPLVSKVMSYSYNASGHLATQTYPNQLQVEYGYDSYGNIESISSGTNQVYHLDGEYGVATEHGWGNGLTFVSVLDNRGRMSESVLYLPNNTDKYQQLYTYNQNTGNMTSRLLVDDDVQEFTYDALDRLTSWTKDGTTLDYDYESDGSMYIKRDLGSMYYNSSSNPYALTDMENPLGMLNFPQTYVSTLYNELGMVKQITSYSGTANLVYGPANQRWRMTNAENVLYFNNYEEVTTNGVTRSFIYLENGVMAVTDNTNGTQFFYRVTDHLGSVIAIVDEDGDEVFAATYDPWGKQTVTRNDIGFRRGFTGHEMLPKFDLINMNGRLYDPYLARFLSPDNYVQMPDFSQSFNRYSYCLNNPLKYTDPDGEIAWWVVAAFVGGAFNVAANMDDINNAGDFFGYFGVGAVAGVVGGATGGLVIGTGGILGGTLAGFVGGAISGFILGAGNSIVANGWNMSAAFNAGINGMVTGAITGAVIGGAVGGISAYKQGNNIWTGKSDEIPFGGKGAQNSNDVERSAKETKVYRESNEPHLVNQDAQKPLQNHHFATDKNKTYTPEMENIARKYNLDLKYGDWNQELLPHLGRHPNEYHEWVLDNMRIIDNIPNMNQQRFIMEFNNRVKIPIRNNPEMLYKKYWTNH